MRLLLDTQVYLWVVMGSPRLSAAARSAIESAEQTFVSAASIWEIGIQARLGKIEADPDELVAAIEQSGFLELPVRAAHAAAAARLPLGPQRPVRPPAGGAGHHRAAAADDRRRGAGALQRSGCALVAPCLAEGQRHQPFTFKT